MSLTREATFDQFSKGLCFSVRKTGSHRCWADKPCQAKLFKEPEVLATIKAAIQHKTEKAPLHHELPFQGQHCVLKKPNCHLALLERSTKPYFRLRLDLPSAREYGESCNLRLTLEGYGVVIAPNQLLPHLLP